MNRAILSRINAKKPQAQPDVEVAKPKKDLGKIVQKDPITGEVVNEFDNIDQAVDEGFSLPHIVKALKGDTKYKGHLWTTEIE